jgi:DNA invertase Pin-like site-specific DNA recombinase
MYTLRYAYRGLSNLIPEWYYHIAVGDLIMTAAVVGYARVSSIGQSLDVQLDKLRDYGCTKVFSEKRSGRQADSRPALQECLSFLREGDELVITKLDRMARSVLDLAKIADRLRKKDVTLKVLDQAIDTSSSEGKLMFSLLGAFAEFENDIRSERQADGIAKAKQKGVVFGRKRALTAEQCQRIKTLREEENFSIPQLAERFNVGPATIYRALQELV